MRPSPIVESTSAPATMRGGDALAAQLVREGVRHIFGVPGVQLDYAMDGLARLAGHMTYVNTRHEQAAAYMADGYARSTGDVGVCMVVPGPGLLNAGAGLATAYACSSRVLCIVGDIPSSTVGRGLGMLHEIPDQSLVLRSLTRWSARATEPADVPRLLRQALHQLRTGHPGPVGLEVPPDVLQASGDVTLLTPADDDVSSELDSALVEAAIELLARAERPVLYAGGGVVAAGASGALQRLAERLRAPVVISRNGRGALDDRHPLALTWLPGREVLASADVVLAVGSRFLDGEEQIRLRPSSRLVLLNIEARDLGKPRVPTLALHADALYGLTTLGEALGGVTSSTWRPEELRSLRSWAEQLLMQVQPQYSWVRALRAALPEDGIFVNEFTQVGYMATVSFPVYGPRTYVGPGYQGTLGYGFPTALGVKVAQPHRAVLCITGDGGFGFGLAELATARKHTIALVTVVFNDNAYGNVRRTQVEQFDNRVLGSDLTNPDFVRLAESCGIRGARASTPGELEGLLRETLDDGSEPVVIDVPVGPMPSPFQTLRTARRPPAR
ncbi:MAG TPA: thiamine pyrophosphate-dependent enzyme [Chloroflexota bacterium]|nr:thiamine pyrophosphate-dependent enzyme [Chloroflexota bacterium]